MSNFEGGLLHTICLESRFRCEAAIEAIGYTKAGSCCRNLGWFNSSEATTQPEKRLVSLLDVECRGNGEEHRRSFVIWQKDETCIINMAIGHVREGETCLIHSARGHARDGSSSGYSRTILIIGVAGCIISHLAEK